MSTTKYNLKNPGVKRIMQEARELANESTYEYDAHPLEDNIFEWHFTVRGPKDTDFENGRYHGRIILPNEYPFKPPELIFLTPNGRFELNTKICLSITGFHPEFWQPAWGIRTVLLAVIGFFPTEARGAIGGLDYTPEERKRLAKKSIRWICPVCQVNTKDALSDTPPEVTENGKREELPDFMITYKPTTAVEEKKSEEKAESSSSTGNSIDKAVSMEEDAAEKDRVPAVENNDAKAEPSDKPSAWEIVKQEKEADAVAVESSQPTIEEDGYAVTATTIIHDEAPTAITTTTISEPPPRSPLWLDALIGGLVSVLIGLLCRKYIL